MTNKTIHKTVIIGSGPAGLTAAIYAGRANLKPIVFEGNQPGGQLTITTDVENFPGFPNGVMGPEMMDLFRDQAKKFGAECHFKHVTKVDFSSRPFKIFVGEEKFLSETVIISTGASARYLGLDSEQHYLSNGGGVSACAVCDGFFYKDQEVAIVGGGDTAAEEATYLANICSKVTMLVRRDVMRASKAMQHRVNSKKNIELKYNSEVVEVLGDNVVEGIKVVNNKTNKTDIIDITGFFVAIGHKPNTDIFEGQLEMDNGYIIIKSGLNGSVTSSSIDGVFAAGDVSDQIYRQAVTSAGFGCMAALDAEKFLSEK